MRLDVLAGTGPATLTAKWYQDGTQADAGDVTVTITDANGTAVAEDEAATKTGSGASTAYTYDLPIDELATPRWLRIAWKIDDGGGYISPATTVEVTENVGFTETDARAVPTVGNERPLNDAGAVYTDAIIAANRLKMFDIFEARTGRSWTARYCRVQAAGDGTDRLVPRIGGRPRTADGYTVGGSAWHRDIIRPLSVTVEGETVDPATVETDGDAFYLDGYWPCATRGDRYPIVVEYVYGQDPVPYEAKDAALELLLSRVVPSSFNAFAETVSNETGTFRFNPPFPRNVWEFLRSQDRRIAIG